jgi:hypothetical protein
MRKAAAGFLGALGLALSLAVGARADEVPPQRPDQISFNARVTPGTVLVVAESLTGGTTSVPFCTAIPSLKTVWAQEMGGQDVAVPATCSDLPSGSRVKVLRKTSVYAIDDPSQPADPYGNDAHLIIETVVLSVPPAAGGSAKTLVGRTGYLIVDSLEWPAP